MKKKFEAEDIIINYIKTYPENDISFFSGSVYINNLTQISSSDSKNQNLIAGTPLNLNGNASKYYKQFMINRINPTDGSIITPAFIAGTNKYRYNKSSDELYKVNSFPSSSINIIRVSAPTAGSSPSPYISSLKNTLEWYSSVSKSYEFSKFSNTDVCIVNIPSVFYGSSIKKGSVELFYYFTGSLVSKLQDYKNNGELVVMSGTSSGSTAGVVLYEEGLILLTSSFNLQTGNGTSWRLFATSSVGFPQPYNSGSFQLKFKGTNIIPTITMYAHAEKEEFNFPSDPTAISSDSIAAGSSTFSLINGVYIENTQAKLANTVKSNYNTVAGEYKPQTFITKIGIFDINDNLLGIAKLATPIKKNSEREYTFKIKVDL